VSARAKTRKRRGEGANLRLGLLLAAMVVVPLTALGLVGARLVTDQRALAQHEIERGFLERMKSLDQAVQTIMRGFERELARASAELPKSNDPSAIRDAMGRLPRSSMVLVLDETGKVVHPPLTGEMSQREVAFLERTRPIWEGGLLTTVALKGALEGTSIGPERGWMSFFHGGGQHFLWWRTDARRVIALEVSGIDLMTELVTQLPDTPLEADTSPGGTGANGLARTAARDDPDQTERTVLADATGRTVYQWGNREVGANERPRAVLGLSAPLESWSLRHYASESALPGAIADSLSTALFGGLGGLALALSAGAFLIWRARTRESRLAAQRVSFVNQVSHELKTPLTNIRLYAELLEGAHEAADIEASDPAARHLAVIMRESDRLSRLIKDVLTFARGEEQKLAVSLRPTVPDEVVQATLATHAPSLAQAGIAVETTLAAKTPVMCDPDALAQIVSNLISNVEKYARQGQWLGLATSQHGDRTVIRVSDRGPGIPRAQRDKVFEPFWRASDKLSDGVTGTGIGLDIARRLARLHDGELRVVDGDGPGAVFELTITTAPIEIGPAGARSGDAAHTHDKDRA
jgi:signal transduction histidine kinase